MASAAMIAIISPRRLKMEAHPAGRLTERSFDCSARFSSTVERRRSGWSIRRRFKRFCASAGRCSQGKPRDAARVGRGRAEAGSGPAGR